MSWKARFEERGHEVLAPATPRMEGEVESLRRNPSVLNGLGLAEVVEHYERPRRRSRRGSDAPGRANGGLITRSP